MAAVEKTDGNGRRDKTHHAGASRRSRLYLVTWKAAEVFFREQTLAIVTC